MRCFPQRSPGMTIANGDAMERAWLALENQAVDARCRGRKSRCCGNCHHHKTPARRRSNIRPNCETDHAEAAIKHSEALLFSFYARTLFAARRGTRRPTRRVSCSRQGSGPAISLSRAATSRARTCARSGRRSAAVAARGPSMCDAASSSFAKITGRVGAADAAGCGTLSSCAAGTRPRSCHALPRKDTGTCSFRALLTSPEPWP